VRPGAAGRGWARLYLPYFYSRQGRVPLGLVGRGGASPSVAILPFLGVAWQGSPVLGMVGFGRSKARPGRAWYGAARLGYTPLSKALHGGTGRDAAWLGPAGHGATGLPEAGFGNAGMGMTRYDSAWLGKATSPLILSLVCQGSVWPGAAGLGEARLLYRCTSEP